MKKVIVLGCPGSGKTTFSVQLGEIIGLPVIHLDAYYWKPGWVGRDKEEWETRVRDLLRRDSYIMDGNFTGTLDLRLPAADTIFFFNFSRYLCIYRVFKRIFINYGRTRADMGKDCPEKLDFHFIKYVWNFNKNYRIALINKLEQYKGTKNVIIFKTPRQVHQYLAGDLSS